MLSMHDRVLLFLNTFLNSPICYWYISKKSTLASIRLDLLRLGVPVYAGKSSLTWLPGYPKHFVHPQTSVFAIWRAWVTDWFCWASKLFVVSESSSSTLACLFSQVIQVHPPWRVCFRRWSKCTHLGVPVCAGTPKCTHLGVPVFARNPSAPISVRLFVQVTCAPISVRLFAQVPPSAPTLAYLFSPVIQLHPSRYACFCRLPECTHLGSPVCADNPNAPIPVRLFAQVSQVPPLFWSPFIHHLSL